MSRNIDNAQLRKARLKERQNRAILNRDLRHCHPPASAHSVDKILEYFRSGRQMQAPFWINLGGRMIHIEYFALRNDEGNNGGPDHNASAGAPSRRIPTPDGNGSDSFQGVGAKHSR